MKRPSVLAVVGAFGIGVAAPGMGTRPPWFDDRGPVVAATLALVAIVAVPRRWWPVRLLIAGAAAAVTYQANGETAALWLASSLLLAAWVAADRPPVPIARPCPLDAVLLVAVPAALAVPAGRPLGATWQPLAMVAVGYAIAAACVGREVPVRRWARAAARAAAGTAGALGRTVSTAFVRDRAAGWVAPTVAADPTTPRGRRPGRRGLRPWVRMAGVAAAGLLVVGAIAVGVRQLRTDPAQDQTATGIVAVGASGSEREVAEDLAWATDPRVAWRPLRLRRLQDVATRTVNVHGGHRGTWQPPACDCPEVTLWFYGGSGAFGVGQRDDHTIASELARLARRDGIALRVVNGGTIGQPHWRNATLFSWDATTAEPDLVLFYNGAEEIDTELELRRRGLGDVLAPFDPTSAAAYEQAVPEAATIVPPGHGATKASWPTTGLPDPGLGRLAVERYERARKMSGATAEALGVPVRYAWQPDRLATGNEQGTLARAVRAARAALPDDVIDLSATLADHPDAFRTHDQIDERGARLVAAALWSALRPQVRTLAGGS